MLGGWEGNFHMSSDRMCRVKVEMGVNLKFGSINVRYNKNSKIVKEKIVKFYVGKGHISPK